jgi:hypothetical protein
MQEVSGSIPLGSTNFALRGRELPEKPVMAKLAEPSG